MYRWRGLAEVPADWGRSVVTIGVFDGVHRGHQLIAARTVEAAAELGIPAAAVTFDPHPIEVVRPGTRPVLLCSVRRRVELLAGLGLDAVCVLPFTREFSQLKPEEFEQAVLADRLHARRVVIGRNFRFGHRAAGDVTLLAQLGEKHDFTVDGVDLLTDSGVKVSSSGIRELLAAGDVAGAARELGRPHRVEGEVVPGHRRGRALGFPTANIRPLAGTAVPADGVYAGWLAVLGPDGEQADRWPAALSVGSNPTFGDQERSVEAYVLDRDDLELYGSPVAAEFTARIRDMTRFDSAEALTAQMRADVAQARALTGGARPEI